MSGRRALVPYFVLGGVSTMSLGAVFTMLAEFRDRLGISESGLGLMVSMGFFAAFASQIGLARFSDRGHAKRMIRIGLLAIVASLVIMVVGTELWQLVAARIVLGVGIGAIFPSLRRIVINFDPPNVGANLGLLGSFDVSGFIVGPLVAAVLVQTVGFRAPFVVLAIATAAFIPFVSALPADTGKVGQQRNVVRALLGRRGMQAALVVAIGWFAMIGVFESVWALLLTDHGAETWVIGVTLSIIVFPMIFLAPWGGRIAQRHGPLRVAGVGVLLTIPCVMMYGFVASVPVLALLAFLQGAGDAVTFPATQVAAAMTADEEQLASAQGLVAATLELAAGTVALIAGVTYEAFGPEELFVGTGIAMAIGVGIAAVIARPLAENDDPVVYGGTPRFGADVEQDNIGAIAPGLAVEGPHGDG